MDCYQALVAGDTSHHCAGRCDQEAADMARAHAIMQEAEHTCSNHPAKIKQRGIGKSASAPGMRWSRSATSLCRPS